MRIPDPKANTTTEAYLAYKAGYLEESELKPVLYNPDWHFDGWLAYWAGLVPMYPIKSPGKNLFNKNDIDIGWNWVGAVQSVCYPYNLTQRTRAVYLLPVEPNTKYTVSLASSDWYVMEIIDVDSNFTVLSKSKTTQENAFTQTITTGEHYAFLGFKFKYGSAGTTTITKEMLPELKLQVELGDTATSYEDYTGDPEMLCDEEALVAYLAGVTDTYPEEIKDPYDVRIVGYLRHLASIRWPEPDYSVNNEEFYLSTMEPTHTSNPEPSSDIELDTAEGKIISVEAYGDTHQQTYSGKNLLPPVPNRTITSGGINFTATDELITGSGTLTAVPPNISYQVLFDQSLPAGTYTFSIPEANTYMIRISLLDSDNSWHSGNAETGIPAGQTSKTITTTYTAIGYRLTLGNTRVGQEINLSIKNQFQFEAGSTATDYEPYVGGASPNPDYPQDVNVVTGEQTVTVSDGTNSQSYTVDLGATELCKIGDYQDYIYKNGDDWYLHKEIGKVVYDGTENWTFGSASALRVLVDLETNMKRYTTNALCSHLAYGDTASASEDNVFNIGGSKVFAKATAITTSASSWKTWLKTHNVSLYYQLSTPTDTQITDATLVGQLDALAGADTYNEKTFIKVTATEPNLPALLKVEAYKY